MARKRPTYVSAQAGGTGTGDSIPDAPRRVSAQREGDGYAAERKGYDGKKHPISIDLLKKLIEETERTYADQDAAIEEGRACLEWRNDIPIGSDYLTTGFKVRSAEYVDEIIRVGSLLTANEPTCQVTFKSDAETKQQLQDKIEQATVAMLLRAAGHEGKTYKRVGKSGAQDGGAWSRMVWKSERWEDVFRVKRDDFEDDEGYDPLRPGKKKSRDTKYVEQVEQLKKGAPFPITWDYIDPKTVRPLWRSDGELSAVLVVSERPLWSTLRDYGLTLSNGEVTPEMIGEPQPPKRNATSATTATTIRFVEHWDDTYVTYFLDHGRGYQIDQFAHDYKCIPFAHSYGETLAHQGNIKVGLSAGYVLKSSVDYLSYLKTLHANLAAKSIAPTYQRQVPQGLDVVRNAKGQVQETTEIKPNQIINLRPGESIQPFTQAESNPQIREQITMTQEQVQQLRGPQTTGNLNDASNGFAIQSVLSEYRIRLSPYISGLQDHLKQATVLLHKLIKHKGQQTVYVQGPGGQWLSLGPDDLAEGFDVEWDISPETPSAKIVERRHIVEGIQAGLETVEGGIIAEGRSPAEVRKQQLKEMLRQTPEYQQMATAEFLAQAGRGDLALRYAAAAQLAQTGVIPPSPDLAGGMGAGGLPGDFGAMTMAPGGVGANPAQMAPMQTPGSVPGQPSGPVVPTQAATASVQSLGR